MRVNELFEVSANPDYLRAAERSLGQAIATQRTFGKSPEEKAAARRTELKREKGMQGYGRRHRAANPEMYPEIKPRPAAKLRDPSTEYSDDYSVWAAGRRDTMEQGVAEVSDATLTSYLTKVDKDNLKHKMDPTRRSDAKRMKSGPNFVKAFNKLDSRREQGVAEGSEQSPEKEIERLKLRQDAEHGGASLKRQAATQARIRKLEKQIKDKQGVAEGRTK
jgi:hypothetical protein